MKKIFTYSKSYSRSNYGTKSYKYNNHQKYQNTNYSNGRTFQTRINFSGYREYNDGTGWKLTHRRVIEKTIGGRIPRGFEVHHKNGNKLDNRKSNLELVTKAEHKLIHEKRSFGGIKEWGRKKYGGF